MFGFDSMSILSMIAGIPGLVIAMVVHEYAHARTAVAMGDDTPRLTGRLTFNPIAHIDPIGLLMLFIVQFGWAKPVMIDPRNFSDWKKGNICVSLAGPGANLVTAFLALLVMVIYGKFFPMSYGLRMVFYLIVLYNINFAIFNMIPLPPLDGSKVLMALLPWNMAYKLASLERYSFIILIALMMTPILGYILIPLQQLFLHAFGYILYFIFGGATL